MLSYLKPAQYSRQTLTIFWGVQILNFLTISSHWVLSTSTLPLNSILRLYVFTASLPVLLYHFSKNIFQITLSIVVLLYYMAYVPFFSDLKILYYIITLLAFVINAKSFLNFQFKSFNKHHLIAGILILTFNICTNWFSNFNYLQLLYSGWIHGDTLWLTSLAAMYKTYNVISIGVDGLLPTIYHSFTLKVYAGLSIVSGLTVIQIMSMFHPVAATTVLFLTIAITIKSVRPNFTITVFIQYLLIYFLTYGFFIYRTVNTTYDFFWSQSMFLGSVLFLLNINLLNNYIEKKQHKIIFLIIVVSIIIAQTKSNIGVINIILIGMVTFLHFNKDILVISFYLIIIVSCSIILYPVYTQNISSDSTTYSFAEAIIKYESLLPRFGIYNKTLRIIYYSIIFYLPYSFYIYQIKKLNRKLISNNALHLTIHLTFVISIVFNYFFSIGFDTFYFTGPNLFFSVIGITSLVNINSKFLKFIPLSTTIIIVYSLSDMWRMGNKYNPHNYIYNYLNVDERQKSKKLINDLLAIKSNPHNIVDYNFNNLPTHNFSKYQTTMLVPALTECVTVGHVPEGRFYGDKPYSIPYKLKLPKSPINILELKRD
jgi:hypothetical protein